MTGVQTCALRSQKQWQKEVAKRKQVYQLQRVLRENIEQWRNERFYERNILDLSV